MLSVRPRSRADRSASNLASGPEPCSWATIRGATAATAGSAKCGSSGSSQPCEGTQSESTKATSGVSQTARPVLRAAAGPPFTSRRMSRAPAWATTRAMGPGSGEASSTTTTGCAVPTAVRQRASSAARPYTGTTTVSAGGSPAAPLAAPSAVSPAGPGFPAVVVPQGGTGCIIAASTSRRASSPSARFGPTGAPACHPATTFAPAGDSRSSR